MAPTISCRDVSHKLHRRQKKQQMHMDSDDRDAGEDVITSGSGEGMSVATSGRSRMVVKSNTKASKGAAVRRRCRRGVVWLLHEVEDSRISTTTDSNAVSTATKEYEEECEDGDYSAEEYEYSDMEEEVDSRFGRLSEPLEGQKKPGGLLGITMRTVELIRRNQLLQWRLSLLQEETRAFVKSVMNNPENRRVDESKDNETKDNVSDGAQDPSVSGSC